MKHCVSFLFKNTRGIFFLKILRLSCRESSLVKTWFSLSVGFFVLCFFCLPLSLLFLSLYQPGTSIGSSISMDLSPQLTPPTPCPSSSTSDCVVLALQVMEDYHMASMPAQESCVCTHAWIIIGTFSKTLTEPMISLARLWEINISDDLQREFLSDSSILLFICLGIITIPCEVASVVHKSVYKCS